MTRIRSLTAGVLVAGLLMGTGVFAQVPRSGGPGGPAGRAVAGVGLALRALNLTEAQQQQVRDIRQRHREDAQRAAESLRQATDAQRKAVETIPLDEGLIRSTTIALAEAQTEAAIQEAIVYNEIWSVLTTAQQQQVKTLQSEREARVQQRQERRRRN